MQILSQTPIPLDWHEAPSPQGARFSIIIPTWNNLPFLRLCVRSIRQNSAFPHQIILHINDGSDGTLDWARSEGLAFSFSPGNAGICLAVNAARRLVATDYILYMNDDMYVCPGWDSALLEEIQALPSPFFFLSATMIEPRPTRSLPVIAPHDFGSSPDNFEESRLLDTFMTFPKPDWFGATRPPNIVHRAIWDLVGGYSLEFSPGLYSDPDFSMKLWQAGVRHFKGVSRSRVYHFVSRTLNRIVPNDGRRQFIRKWGVTPSAFYRSCLRKGQPFTDVPLAPAPLPLSTRISCAIQRHL